MGIRVNKPSGKTIMSLYTPPSQAVCGCHPEHQPTVQYKGVEDEMGGHTPCFPGIPTSHSIRFIDPSVDLVGLA